MLTYLGLFIFCIIIIYLVLCIYIKIKFHFWSLQPVFHIYDIMYWIKPPKRILYDFPPLNKYVNLVNIQTITTESLSETKSTRICNFINSYYLRGNKINYLPSKSNIMSYLNGSNYPSYVSIYTQSKLLFDKPPLEFKSAINDPHFTEKKALTTPDTTLPVGLVDDYISVVTARILHITMKGVKTLPLYYVDHLCVHPDHRKKGIAAEMIATQYYCVSRLQPKVYTYLFKREGILNAIIPLTTFTTYGYDISAYAPHLPSIFPTSAISLMEISVKNIRLFTYFMKECNKFDCIVLPEISSIANLIKTENYYIYGIFQKDLLHAVYVLKKQSVWVKSNANAVAIANAPANANESSSQIIDCIASLSNCDPTLFVIGFKQVLQQIQKRDKTIEQIMIENTSHNSILISQSKTRPNTEYPSAFFLYNYGCYSYPSKDCFFMY